MGKWSLWHIGVLRSPLLLAILLLILPVSGKASDINIWYGLEQDFGEIGLPQQWVNILGDVSDPDGIQSLTYSLDGGISEFNLSVGPDGRRLNDTGDFNVEIDFADLADGPNDVLIKATDMSDNVSLETLTLNKSESFWPIPYSIDWSLVTNIQDVAQIVDGLWTIGSDGVRSVQPGYDRILAIGDVTWTDYEVTVPITIHSIDPAAFDPDIYPYSVGPGLGIIFRWQGHVDVDGSQPTWGWWESGASAWYEFFESGGGLLDLNGDGFYSVDPANRTLDFGVRYFWKMRVQTIPGSGSQYRLKVWEDGQGEPLDWQMSGLEPEDALANGSFLLVAHHVDATFGNVTVIPTQHTLTVNTVGNGTVDVDPDQPLYDYGTEVILTAIPDLGWEFIGWTGDLLDPDLSVEIAPDNSYVILENSEIRVEYRAYFADFDQFAIRHFFIKGVGNEDQVGIGTHAYFDADSSRGVLSSASIIYDDLDRKTVHLEWDKKDDPSKKIIHEVSIFPNGKFLKIDYIDVQHGLNSVDLGMPGGGSNGTHVAYGGDSWIRGYVTQDVSSYYNRYLPDGVNDPADGGSLNYNDHFIIGVYNSANNRGFARVMPVADIDIIKLLLSSSARRGLEFFPYPFFQAHAPFTGYLYAVTGGEGEILSLGQKLADGNYGQWGPSSNPATLIMNRDKTVTANFERLLFGDVPPGHWAEEAIYTLYDAGITKGCSTDLLLYCPDKTVSKAAMAVFLLRSMHGGNYTPPPATGIFTDVDVNQWYAPWVEQLYREGITQGCSADPLMYCPDRDVSKASMAVFLLRSIHGGNYTPPPATGIFTDVDVNQWYAPWVEQLYREGITQGCSADPLMYCPDRGVSRAAMALFLVRTFDL